MAKIQSEYVMFLHNNVVIFLDALTSKDILWQHFDINIYKNLHKNLRFIPYFPWETICNV